MPLTAENLSSFSFFSLYQCLLCLGSLWIGAQGGRTWEIIGTRLEGKGWRTRVEVLAFIYMSAFDKSRIPMGVYAVWL